MKFKPRRMHCTNCGREYYSWHSSCYTCFSSNTIKVKDEFVVKDIREPMRTVRPPAPPPQPKPMFRHERLTVKQKGVDTMAKKFIIFGSGEPEETPYDYDIGEVIRVNSQDLYMCKTKTMDEEGNIIHLFKKGKVTFD